MRRIVMAAALLAPLTAMGETGAERLRRIRAVHFSPEQCHRVRDLFLERDDIKLHFSDGFLLFADPLDGRTMAALFLAATDTGEGEIIVLPPTRSERQSMARFLNAPILQEHIRTAMMFFTDDTAEVLRRAMAENPYNRADPEAGEKLAADWRPVARNMVASYEARMLLDSLSPLGPAAGFFAAALSGVKLGRFDLLVDPRRLEQVSLGQAAWQEGQRYYDVWANFPGRSFRERRREPVNDGGRLEDYHIDAAIAPELDMRVRARATLVAGPHRERVVGFELSRQMKLTALLVDGRPVEFLQNEALDSSGIRRRGNDWLLAVLEQPLEPGSRHRVEFHYEGNVITDAGNGVYYVGARGTWYPGRGFPFTTFELAFHHPKRLQLVATGRLVETSVEGDVRTSRFRPDGPIRIAGFNLGDFERASLKAGDYTIEVCANKQLEPALLPPLPLPPMEPPHPLPVRRFPQLRPPAPLLPSAPEPTPTPVRRIDQVARETVDALEFFADRLGPPPVSHLVISPIPGRFGQGFPGLVYISTLSYYQPEDRPLARLTPQARLFYSEHLRAHEIAHQWWGNLVTSAGYHDEWLMESLADYSALLFLEHQQGGRVLEGVLARYRDNLLSRTESGDTVESAGPIALGERLRTSRSPKAQQTITYEKGSWVLHMLRRLLGDQKFLAMLAELRRRFEYRAVSTEQFRELAASFLPAVPQDPNLENFFSQWVYSTGLPTLKMDYKVTGKAPRWRLAGVVRQSGVPEDFSIPVPIEIQLQGKADRLETRVQTAGGEAPFSMTLQARPTRVVLDPKDSVLAVK